MTQDEARELLKEARDSNKYPVATRDQVCMIQDSGMGQLTYDLWGIMCDLYQTYAEATQTPTPEPTPTAPPKRGRKKAVKTEEAQTQPRVTLETLTVTKKVLYQRDQDVAMPTKVRYKRVWAMVFQDTSDSDSSGGASFYLTPPKCVLDFFGFATPWDIPYTWYTNSSVQTITTDKEVASK